MRYPVRLMIFDKNNGFYYKSLKKILDLTNWNKIFKFHIINQTCDVFMLNKNVCTNTPDADACDSECVTPEPSPITNSPG